MEILTVVKLATFSQKKHTTNQGNHPLYANRNTSPDTMVSISPQGASLYAEEQKLAAPIDKKDLGASLRLDSSGVGPSENTQQTLTVEEKLDQRIAEVQEALKELQKEISALIANDSEQAAEELKDLNQQLKLLLGQLTNLMQLKLSALKNSPQ